MATYAPDKKTITPFSRSTTDSNHLMLSIFSERKKITERSKGKRL